MKKNSKYNRPLTQGLGGKLAAALEAAAIKTACAQARASWNQIAELVRELGGDITSSADWRTAEELLAGN